MTGMVRGDRRNQRACKVLGIIRLEAKQNYWVGWHAFCIVNPYPKKGFVGICC